MGLPEMLAVLMVVVVCGLLFFGYPVALTLGGVSLAFAALGHITGAMASPSSVRCRSASMA